MNKIKGMMLDLIQDYISCASYMCKAMKYNFNTNETLLRSRRINLIPQHGYLPEGISFSFHGIGCYFEFENGEIDIDFGPNDRCDGFDSYRLYNFLEQTKKESYLELHNKTIFQKEFDSLISEGVIVQSEDQVASHLFYLKNKNDLK